MTADARTPARGRRGRPLSERSHAAILDAALGLLGERGTSGMTMEAVAERASASKATVYRHFASKEELVVAAVGGLRPENPSVRSRPGDDAREQLVTMLTRMHAGLRAAPGARLLPRLVGDALDNPRLAEVWRERVVEPRRAAIAAILSAAVVHGRLPASVDVELAVDLLMAPLFYRHLLPLPATSSSYPARIVDVVWAALAAGLMEGGGCSGVHTGGRRGDPAGPDSLE